MTRGKLALFVAMILIIGISLSSAAEFPAEFRGLWKPSDDLTACTAADLVEETSRRIEDKTLLFWEGACSLKTITGLSIPKTFRLTLSCSILENKPWRSNETWNLTKYRTEELLNVFYEKTGAILSFRRCN
jgi:hypothetical protein